MQNADKNKEELYKTIIALIFVFSGTAGLIYQIVWFKYLSLSVGNSTFAQMIVLATFLSGLAIGNYIFGKKTDSLTNPLKIYAIIEITIGIYAAAYPILDSIFSDLFFTIASGTSLESGDFSYNLLRFVLSAVLLLIPTIAMGGTLPLLTSFFVNNIENTRKDVATLYFLNSFGAVFGVFLAGFLFIETFGLELTIYIAGMVNLILGFIAYVISGKVEEFKILNKKENRESNIESNESNNKISYPKINYTTILTVAGLSGMSALIYEMAWVRLFINIFGSSTYVFSIMLAAFISGITIGSFIVTKSFIKKYNSLLLIGISQFAIALGSILALLLAGRLPYYTWVIASFLNKTETTFSIFIFAEFFIAFVIMFIPTLFMGVTLPLIVEVVSHSNYKAGSSVGRVFSVNTIGTVVGVLLTGIVFIPLWGMQGSFNIGIIINILAGLLVILTATEIKKIYKNGLIGFSLIIFAVYLFSANDLGKSILLGGVFKKFNSKPPSTYYKYSNSLEKKKVLFYKEGISANVAVLEGNGKHKQKILIINGKPDASSYGDMPTQVMLAQVPMMLHPNPKNVFVVGFGSGVTINSVLTHPVKKVTCAEISKEVIEAGNIFKNENNNCLSDTRLKVIIEDAHAALKLSKTNYDVIISEPSNPWIAGIGNLFSKEYFETCKSKLDTNGIMVQWFHLYEVNDNVVKLVLNTFRNVFKYAQIWNGVSNDILLVGSKSRIKLNSKLLKEKFQQANIKKDFNKIGINNVFTFLTCQSNSTEGFYGLTASKKPINTELKPLLEFEAPKSFYLHSNSTFIYDNDERFDTLYKNILAKQYWKINKVSYNNLLNTAEYHFNKTRNYHFVFGVTDFLRNKYPINKKTERLYSDCLKELEFDNRNKMVLKNIVEHFPDAEKEKTDYLNILLTEKLYSSTFVNLSTIDTIVNNFISTASRDSSKLAKTYLQLSKVYLQNSNIKKSEEMLKGLFAIVNKKPEAKDVLPLDDYYYVSLMLAYYRDDEKSMLDNFSSLLNTNNKYPEIYKFKGLINAKMELRE